MESREYAKVAVDAIEDKKGVDIRIIDISNVSTIADYFIIANGTNPSQVQAIADNVEEKLYKNCNELEPRNIEGYREAGWILLDYEDIIIHIFSEEDREFYNLERLWKDGKEITKEDL